MMYNLNAKFMNQAVMLLSIKKIWLDTFFKEQDLARKLIVIGFRYGFVY